MHHGVHYFKTLKKADGAAIVAVKVGDQDARRTDNILRKSVFSRLSISFLLVPDRIILHTYGSGPKRRTPAAVSASHVAALS